MTYDVVASYGCDPDQVAPARRWTHQALSQRLGGGTSHEVVEDAVLVVSELVTNAIQADCSEVSVGLAVESDAVLIGVTDDAGGVPRSIDASHAATAGRGLRIVAAVAHQWGVRPLGVDGRPVKEVWARLRLRGDRPTG